MLRVLCRNDWFLLAEGSSFLLTMSVKLLRSWMIVSQGLARLRERSPLILYHLISAIHELLMSLEQSLASKVHITMPQLDVVFVIEKASCQDIFCTVNSYASNDQKYLSQLRRCWFHPSIHLFILQLCSALLCKAIPLTCLVMVWGLLKVWVSIHGKDCLLFPASQIYLTVFEPANHWLNSLKICHFWNVTC